MKIESSQKSGTPLTTFTDNDGTVTLLTRNPTRGDLIIEQRAPGKPPVILTTYDSFGTAPYAILLHFLMVNHAEVPRPSSPRRKVDKYDRERDKAENQALRLQSDIEKGGTIFEFGSTLQEKASAHFITSKNPAVEFIVGKNKINISISLAQSLVKYIPQMYGGNTTAFRRIYAGLYRFPRQFGETPLRRMRGGGESPKGNPGDRAYRKKPLGPARGMRARRRMGH